MPQPSAVVIIPAAGQGRRMGGIVPKQYLPLRGRPVLWHTLDCFEQSPLVHGMVVAARPQDMAQCQQVAASFRKIRALVEGGRERWESVRAGLEATYPSDELILVHDAVRPFVSQALIRRVIEAAAGHLAAIPALPVRETVKVVGDGLVVETPARARLWAAQTPQGFARELLLAACAGAAAGMPATDEAVLVERLGHPVRVVEGEPGNLKLTTPEDLEWAEWRVRQREGGTVQTRGLRVGQGYDVHRLEAGRQLVLGGVAIPFERGLAGHSDADVLTHAIMDALLGAAGAGDIGRLFPDTDPAYRGISSLVLLEQVQARLQERGAVVLNIDAVLMAQRPRIAPQVPEMIGRLAAALRLAPERISLKATTTERLGFVGREEGIAAQAVALIEI